MRPVIQAELRMGGDAKWYRRSDLSVKVWPWPSWRSFRPARRQCAVPSHLQQGRVLVCAHGQGRPLSVNGPPREDILAQAPNEWNCGYSGPQLDATVAANVPGGLSSDNPLAIGPIQLPASGRHSLRRAKLRVHSPDPCTWSSAAHRRFSPAGQLTSAASAHPRSDELLKRLVWPSWTTPTGVPTSARHGPTGRQARSIRPQSLARAVRHLVYPSGEG